MSRLAPLWRSLYFQSLLGVLLGALLGWKWPAAGVALKPLGTAFISLVRMVTAPLIFLTLVTGIARLGHLGALGRLAGKALLYFFALSTLALVVGLVVANVLRPGAGMHIDPSTLDGAKVGNYIARAHEESLAAFLLNLIPVSLPAAVVNGEILQALLVALLVGVSAAQVGDKAQPLINWCESALAVTFRIVEIIMRLAPVAAFGGMAFTVSEYGAGSLRSLGFLLAAFYGTSLGFVILVLGLVAWLNRFSLWKLLRYLKDELLLILGTSSSESALPRLMEKLERAGCARSVVSVVVPTGYSFNLDGTNIYLTLAALFLAQALDLHLSLGAQLSLLLVAILTSKGAAGVTGAGFIALAATLAVMPTTPSVPPVAMALIVGIDRFMSECRSLTNFIGNAVATVVVARWEGALDLERLRSALDGPVAALDAVGHRRDSGVTGS